MPRFDPGLQPERTELAWRRTALTLAVGSLIAMRLLPAALDDAWWALVGAAGLGCTAALWVLARRRARQVDVMLARMGDRAALPGGGLLLGLSTLVAAIGALAVASVAVVALRG